MLLALVLTLEKENEVGNVILIMTKAMIPAAIKISMLGVNLLTVVNYSTILLNHMIFLHVFSGQINFLKSINLSFILDEYDNDALEDYDSNDDTLTNYENEEYDSNDDDDGQLEDDDNESFFGSEEKDDFEGTS